MNAYNITVDELTNEDVGQNLAKNFPKAAASSAAAANWHGKLCFVLMGMPNIHLPCRTNWVYTVSSGKFLEI